MATTFTDIITRLKDLKFNEWNELNTIKALATELLKRSFPNDSAVDIFKIENLSFKPSWVMHDGRDNSGLYRSAWSMDTAKFKALIEAKKETFDIKQQVVLNHNAKAEVSKVNAYQVEISKLNNELIEAKEEHLRLIGDHSATLDDYSKTMAELNDIIADKDIEITKQKSRTRRYNGTFWTIILGVPGLLFYVGYYLGNNRFDAEKLSMRDTIISLTTQNKHLKDSVRYLEHKPTMGFR